MFQDLANPSRREHESAKEPVGESGLHCQPVDPERTSGDIRGVLKHAPVSCHQGRCQESVDLPQGEVPRHDSQHHAQRAKGHIGLRATGLDELVAQYPLRVLRVVTTHPGALVHLTQPLGDRLSHLVGDQRRQLVPVDLE